jgi:hypothetical protein
MIACKETIISYKEESTPATRPQSRKTNRSKTHISLLTHTLPPLTLSLSLTPLLRKTHKRKPSLEGVQSEKRRKEKLSPAPALFAKT